MRCSRHVGRCLSTSAEPSADHQGMLLLVVPGVKRSDLGAASAAMTSVTIAPGLLRTRHRFDPKLQTLRWNACSRMAFRTISSN